MIVYMGNSVIELERNVAIGTLEYSRQMPL